MYSIVLRVFRLTLKLAGFRVQPIIRGGDDELDTVAIRSFTEYRAHISKSISYEGCADIHACESEHVKRYPVFRLLGECVVCGKPRNFYTSNRHSTVVDGELRPNWREQLICLYCQLNNRQRAAYHLFVQVCALEKHADIYITEQKTSFYKALMSVYKNTIGSEFLGDEVPYGSHSSKGFRNENLCQLSFADQQFDAVLTYDVLEHIPDYMQALRECYRCLRNNGTLMITVPFNKNAEKNIVRAEITADGEIKHLMEPEYHGNPLSKSGCLCYYHFSWQLLDDLKAAGFTDAYVLLYWSQKYGYLGDEQVMIVAKK